MTVNVGSDKDRRGAEVMGLERGGQNGGTSQ